MPSFSGKLLENIWTLLGATFNNLNTVETNDELLRKSKNKGRLMRVEQNYNAQYFQMKTWLMIVRYISILAVSSEFVPDEYWQGTEVAHKIVFGEGYLTWEWTNGLRGYLYPCFLAIPIYIMQQLKCIHPIVMMMGPRVMQATMTCFAEYKFLSYVRRKFGNETGIEVFNLILSNWFLLFCGSRTLTNTMEMDLNLLAFYYLQTDSIIQFAFFASISFLVRPTSIVMWAPVCLLILTKVWRNSNTSLGCVVVGAGLLCGNTLLDRCFYGRYVFPSWEFFKFNFLEGKSSEFGTHPAMWYFYSALPSIFGLNVIWIILSYVCWPLKYNQHLKISLFYLTVFSIVGHKEIRFLLPIIPHLLVVIGDFICCLDKTGKAIKSSISKYVKRFVYANLALNVMAAVFFSQFHQVGIKPASKLINTDINNLHLDSVNIWVMMPCFSVPVHTYMYNPKANYEFLTCSPPGYDVPSVNSQQVDFSDFNLTEFIQSKLETDIANAKRPDYVLTYEQKSAELIDLLVEYGLIYTVFEDYYHTAFPFDNIGSRVHVLRLTAEH